ncbi:hypothetical protein GQS_08645 [Thermococcus sp. 4557]|uniref:hypothetical protein n=1 Tax=Thermococcus sp. (strain CGMCC 1.5172 / 4557) TaxID=1042877 RepID=UPI000219EE8E|nr:hypothetical protein [Thermococcus sp. 4557]AEK73623.1 hypothetical protein GQS_08645 [Thermococcus sp. 4557]
MTKKELFLTIGIIAVVIIGILYLIAPRELTTKGNSSELVEFGNRTTKLLYYNEDDIAHVSTIAEMNGHVLISISHSEDTAITSIKVIVKSPGDGTVYFLFPKGGPWKNIRMEKQFEDHLTINVVELNDLGILGEGTITLEYSIAPICDFTHPVEASVELHLRDGLQRYSGRVHFIYNFCSQSN